jgi:hypothetical protein
MTPQNLHDIWLIVTVIVTLEVAGIALYLWQMFHNSNRRWFFWALALAFASIGLEFCASEIKNLYQSAPPTLELAWLWLLARTQEMLVLGGVLGYLVFGRNGKSPAVTES